MEEAVRQDIMAVLYDGVASLAVHDSLRVKELSNHVIHNASIFQDEDSITLAVLMYSLSKIMERGGLEVNEITSILKRANESLEAHLFDDYRLAVKLALKKLSKADSRMRFFVGSVLEQAQIKKACKICMHGVSVARVAEMLGITRWELMRYLGKTTFNDEAEESVSVKSRFKLAEKVFGG